MRNVLVGSGLVVLGGALGVLALAGYGRIWPLSCRITGDKPCPAVERNKWVSSPNDTPATAHGGSFSIHGNLDWKQIGTSSAYQTDFYKAGSTATPNYLSIDGVDPSSTTNPASVADIKATGNWEIEIAFLGNSTTPLKICSESNCALSNTALTNTFYLVGDSNGTFTRQRIDRTSTGGKFGSLFYDPNGCGPTSADPHPLCGHPKTVTVTAYMNGAATPTTYRPYHCVDGVCSVGIDHQ